MKTFSPEAVRRMDAAAIESGISGAELMERAGHAAALAILERFPLARRIAILCGHGNNGGDGYVVARILTERGCHVTLFSFFNLTECQDEALIHARRIPESVTQIISESLTANELSGFDLCVDALLGIGFVPPLRPILTSWIAALNASGAPVAALDIPSGLSASDGTVSVGAVTADLTITFSYPKPGLFLGKGPEYCGEIRVAEIGIQTEISDLFSSNLFQFFTLQDARPFFPRLPPFAYKGSRGCLGVVAGSGMFGGAAALSVSAALNVGAGMAVAVTSEVNKACFPNAAIQCRIPADEFGGMRLEVGEVSDWIGKWDAVIVGPGLGRSPGAQNWVRYVLSDWLKCRRAVVDADALFVFSQLEKIPFDLILTPHAGEAAHLARGLGLSPCSDWNDTEQRLDFALKLAKKTGAVIVLKGPRSVIASPNGSLSINGSGHPGLATAGSGDVLSGIIGAFFASGMNAYDAACLGTFVHGFTAETFSASQRGLTADTLVALLPAALKKISPFA